MLINEITIVSILDGKEAWLIENVFFYWEIRTSLHLAVRVLSWVEKDSSFFEA